LLDFTTSSNYTTSKAKAFSFLDLFVDVG